VGIKEINYKKKLKKMHGFKIKREVKKNLGWLKKISKKIVTWKIITNMY
jgi:hypothetical protein